MTDRLIDPRRARRIAGKLGFEVNYYRYPGGAYWYLYDPETTQGTQLGFQLYERVLMYNIEQLQEEIKS